MIKGEVGGMEVVVGKVGAHLYLTLIVKKIENQC